MRLLSRVRDRRVFGSDIDTTRVPDLSLPIGGLIGILLIGVSVLTFFRTWFDQWATEIVVTN